MTNVQDMSIEAYNDIKETQAHIAERIYQLLLAFPDLCDKEIAKNLGIELSTICGRRNELLRAFRIESEHDKVSPFTGRYVKAWRVRNLTSTNVAQGPY